jgi:hypothetical protein
MENIFEAHARIHKNLIFIISCYYPDYAMKYIINLNNKTFNNFFTVFKLDDPKEINEIYEKSNNKVIIFVTKLPTPELYSFNFIKNVYHIHIAILLSDNNERDEYNKYISDIKSIPVQKFVNVKDKNKLYDNKIEDKLFDYIVTLVDRKVNETLPEKNSEKFRRMSQDGNKIILYSKRNLN